mmetsp:Transcript_62627/g.130162  ORF Transcript_62627/g.130162 Transcript_62627/m.130162 type:complete len:204 (-) Transcript_62627:187-798(-)
MLEKYGESGGAEDVTRVGSNHTRFYALSGQRHEGGKCGRADAGYYYAFLLACKHPILQRFVEAVLDGKTRFSGNLLLPDGTSVSASFLDTAKSLPSWFSTSAVGGRSKYSRRQRNGRFPAFTSTERATCGSCPALFVMLRFPVRMPSRTRLWSSKKPAGSTSFHPLTRVGRYRGTPRSSRALPCPGTNNLLLSSCGALRNVCF